MLDYEMLRLIWWVLVVVLLIGFAVTDGFDMGVGALLPIIGKTDNERRVMINSIAPHWDGNQVWLLTAGGALFAAWPLVYAASFSGFYIAMVLTLFALFFRPIGFDYRSKIEDPRWRKSWDWGLFIGGFVPPVVFGVAFGNLFQGVPFYYDEWMRSYYDGGFFGLLNPFGLLAGLLSFAMLTLHGATWLQMKTEGELYQRARKSTMVLATASVLLFVIAGVWQNSFIDGYVITSAIDTAAATNPLTKTVELQAGAWWNNFYSYPVLWVFPALAVLMPLLVMGATKANKNGFAFLFSSLNIVGVIVTAVVALFPFVMPSSKNPNHSLTMWDATASELTLKVMLVAAVIFVPIILAYTIWCYVKMFGRLNDAHIEKNSASLY
ncbi:cytochrome d ubiquinol oxidase subunit II [Ferrimonas balearica]|uniref:cytochrome d ubiquinol oxidase subunit II n=1 Tax=Ferrimonas balearica TaxID=44012 RepID=UPI001C992230|nr:cytochrome d ubiquinol oxidase subunit II [Ferrimonas balearica]MBY5922050.1 cytochrome d ubiquinol oxidase subunit II [Ferrimonas balearica]MBY5994610.1 cytochrome d ubiquinol oxidase subunit II [Ferrimonas balearica]